MTRRTKDERLKLDKFPPLTDEQKAKLADALFEIEKRTRGGAYFFDEVIEDLHKWSKADKGDPQMKQARKLMARFEGSVIDRVKLELELADKYDRGTWNIAFGWLSTAKKSVENYLSVLELFISRTDGMIAWERVLYETVEALRSIDPELGAAYFSRLSSDLYDRVKQDESEKKEELARFIERVSKAATTERDKNLVMAYFNLAIRLHRSVDAAGIVSDAPWRFAHERLAAYYRVFLAGYITADPHVTDTTEIRLLRSLRDKCLPHFLFTAACQVAEMTGEAADLGLCHSHSLTDDQVRLMARAFLAYYMDPDHREGETIYNHSRMIESWKMFVEGVYQNRTGECLCFEDPILAERFLTIFVIESFKQRILSDIELWDFVVSDFCGRSAMLPSSVAMVAEAAGASSLPLLERAYALAQDGELPLEERITALCRIAKLKKKFAA